MNSVAVIIPALNEEAMITRAIASAMEAGATEVIVADGGSSDATIELARSTGATVIRSSPPRARQMNEAAEIARAEALLFLHADTELPRSGVKMAMQALSRPGVGFGGFLLRFREPSLRLGAAAAFINARTLLTREPWGDQAQFISRHAFYEMKRFREMPLLEDYEMAKRMKRVGRVEIVAERVITSGRRFLSLGLLRATRINRVVLRKYRMGVPVEELAEIYRSAESPSSSSSNLRA